jgi:Protein kinase domain
MIGRGYASRVWHCTDTYTGAAVAVKVYHKQNLCPLNHHQIHREAHIHGSISHPNILPFLGNFSDAENIYMVLQYCSKGDLYSYLKQKGRALSESQVRNATTDPTATHMTGPLPLAALRQLTAYKWPTVPRGAHACRPQSMWSSRSCPPLLTCMRVE